MWDKTTCKSAERRVVEIASRLDNWIKKLREKGVLIIHAPSSVMGFYEGTSERERAQSAPFAKSEVPIEWWRDFYPTRESPLPVEDDDWCDDTPKCPIKDIEARQAWPWTRQIATIEIKPEDAVSDDGQEIYNLLVQRGIENILITGVHLNRCVLGRSFGIRQMVMLNKNIVLVRDLTDGLYDPRQKPYVSHEEGVALLVEHVEKYWCPSMASLDLA
jgi:nicotinamidase-related amidase